jgi:hypothetical protein
MPGSPDVPAAREEDDEDDGGGVPVTFGTGDPATL